MFAVEARGNTTRRATRRPAAAATSASGHHGDDRPVRRLEIEPLVTRAICGRSGNATARRAAA